MPDTATPESSTFAARLRQEAVLGRLPLLASEREYGTAGILATGFTYAVATWCFLIGGYAANVATALPGMIALISGSVVGVTLSLGAAALACNRYGLEQIDFVKSCFGQRGAKLVLVFYVINQLGWTGTILVMWGRGVQNIVEAFGVHTDENLVRLMVLVGVLLAFLIVVRGVHVLNVFNGVVTPGLVAVTGLLFYVLLRHSSWHELTALPTLQPVTDARLGTTIAFEYGLGAGFSWWPGIGFLTRNTTSQRNSFWPQIVTLGFGMGIVCCIGLLAGLVFRNYDPTVWMVQAGGRVLGILALLLTGIANLSASAIMMFTAALALRHIRRLHRFSWIPLVSATFVPLLAYVLIPEALYTHGSSFLTYNATMFAPISGILFVDYILLRHQVLNLSQFFEGAPFGHYWFVRGFNPAALVCMIGGQLLYVYLLDPVSLETHGPVRVWTASGPAVVLPMIVYWISAKVWLFPRHLGGYGASAKPIALVNPNL